MPSPPIPPALPQPPRPPQHAQMTYVPPPPPPVLVLDQHPSTLLAVPDHCAASLRGLSVQRCNLSPPSLRALLRLNEDDTDGTALQPLVLPSLWRLSLAHNPALRLTPADSLAIAAACPALRSLDLTRTVIESVSVLAPLAQLPYLDSIALRGTPLALADNDNDSQGNRYRPAVFALIPSLRLVDGYDAEDKVDLLDSEEDDEAEEDEEEEESQGLDRRRRRRSAQDDDAHHEEEDDDPRSRGSGNVANKQLVYVNGYSPPPPPSGSAGFPRQFPRHLHDPSSGRRHGTSVSSSGRGSVRGHRDYSDANGHNDDSSCSSTSASSSPIPCDQSGDDDGSRRRHPAGKKHPGKRAPAAKSTRSTIAGKRAPDGRAGKHAPGTAKRAPGTGKRPPQWLRPSWSAAGSSAAGDDDESVSMEPNDYEDHGGDVTPWALCGEPDFEEPTDMHGLSSDDDGGNAYGFEDRQDDAGGDGDEYPDEYDGDDADHDEEEEEADLRGLLGLSHDWASLSPEPKPVEVVVLDSTPEASESPSPLTFSPHPMALNPAPTALPSPRASSRHASPVANTIEHEYDDEEDEDEEGDDDYDEDDDDDVRSIQLPAAYHHPLTIAHLAATTTPATTPTTGGPDRDGLGSDIDGGGGSYSYYSSSGSDVGTTDGMSWSAVDTDSAPAELVPVNLWVGPAAKRGLSDTVDPETPGVDDGDGGSEPAWSRRAKRIRVR
ncbi:hypothetical protein BC828DRAFT_45558 [Blastocladiella britannica]|nr:hypothetical protein BC828DRAFT_45558 [Blastocladiella britannica]